MRAATARTAGLVVWGRLDASPWSPVTCVLPASGQQRTPARIESIRYLEWVWSVASTGTRRDRDSDSERDEDDWHG